MQTEIKNKIEELKKENLSTIDKEIISEFEVAESLNMSFEEFVVSIQDELKEDSNNYNFDNFDFILFLNTYIIDILEKD